MEHGQLPEEGDTDFWTGVAPRISMHEVLAYVKAMDRGANTLDDVRSHTGMEVGRVRLIHAFLTFLYERMINRDILTKAFANYDHMNYMEDLIAKYQEYLVRAQEDGNPFKVKELVTGLSQAVANMQRLASQFEDLNAQWADRRSASKIVRSLFRVLVQVDPIVAMRCRDAVLAEFQSLVTTLPGDR
jgi:hypothetical protein